jgi:hypothetical protein
MAGLAGRLSLAMLGRREHPFHLRVGYLLTSNGRWAGVGDAYDNALAESIIGLFKTEVIGRRGPWRNFDVVEYATEVGPSSHTRCLPRRTQDYAT